MINVTYLEEAMEKAGFKYQKDLAEAADVSPATVGNALKKGEVRESTAEKLQAACGKHPIGPFTDPDRMESHSREYSVAIPPEQKDEECLERFEGDDCPTSSPTCSGCWDALQDLIPSADLPFNRALCRVRHSWEVRGGQLVYITDDGREKTADEFLP